MLVRNAAPLHLTGDDITGLGAAADEWIASHWDLMLDANASRLSEAFARAGDKAYGTFLGLLLRPVGRALAAADLEVYPRADFAAAVPFRLLPQEPR